MNKRERSERKFFFIKSKNLTSFFDKPHTFVTSIAVFPFISSNIMGSVKSIISSSFFNFLLSFQRFSRSFTNSYSLSGFQGFKVFQSCGSARIGQSLGQILSGIQCLCLSRM
ncbi:EKC/KEOPS complex subunit BUD32 [Frankliniella fusca]|uniref:EKC/KEOPS complex subunit BUD32 n=1 Tax=Frankliniella fusca TaxID=407009 RepID=A0AAE1HAE0_9NEOP|nr:EKC/KEOPS complex subunit BUD32 [Frankliniella fusca]